MYVVPSYKQIPLFKWQKKKRTKYVQGVIMIQAENNNISLTEFSNVTGHFMEDLNAPQMDFSFSY